MHTYPGELACDRHKHSLHSSNSHTFLQLLPSQTHFQHLYKHTFPPAHLSAQNHRIVGVRRHLWRSSSSTPASLSPTTYSPASAVTPTLPYSHTTPTPCTSTTPAQVNML